MLCVHCSTPLVDNARFCTTCGRQVAEAEGDDYANDSSSAPQTSERDVSSPLVEGEETLALLEAVDIQAEHETVSTDQTQRITDSDLQTQPQPLKRAPVTIAPYEVPRVQIPTTPVEFSPSESASSALAQQPFSSDEQRFAHMHSVSETPPPLLFLSPDTPAAPLSYFRLTTSTKVTKMLPAVVNPQPKVARRRRGGLGCLVTLLVLVIVIAGGWFFVFRPYIHSLAEDQLNQAMTSAVDQIPASPIALPVHSLPITETAINNMIVLNTSPSSPIQSPATHITSNTMELDFQLYGQPCSVSLVPQVQNGQLVATNVTDSGIIGLILSPDDITTIMNRHLVDAQKRINQPVQNVQLKDHEVDLTLG